MSREFTNGGVSDGKMSTRSRSGDANVRSRPSRSGGHSEGRHVDLHADARQSTAVPGTAESMDAAKTAILATANSSARGNACRAMKSDIVKPTPASAPAPVSWRQVVSPGPFRQMQATGQSRGQSEPERSA